MVASTVSEDVSLNNFVFITIGVGMDLQSIIQISSEYLQHIFLDTGKSHLVSATPLDPRNNASYPGLSSRTLMQYFSCTQQ
jgi:hypothetical protein